LNRSYFIPLLAVALLGSQPSFAEDWVYLGGSPVAEMDMDSVYVENGLIHLEIRILDDRPQSNILLKQAIEVGCAGSRIHISAEAAITDPSSRLLQRPDAQRVSQQKAFREGMADISPKTVEPDPVNQHATELPSIRNPNAGQRTNVTMPRGLSIAGAAAEGRQEASRTFNMADGSSLTVPVAKPGTASPQAVRNGTKTRMDFIMEQGEQYVLQRLKRGDIAGAIEFRNFMQGKEKAKAAKEIWQAMKREGSSSPELDSLMERADDVIIERLLDGDIEGAMLFRAFVWEQLSEHQRIILIPAKNDAYNTMFDYVCLNVRR
jgi:PII-like signaling protein